ncbi:MAG: hypothetical protein WC865_01010 [Bacteroidales bacterium]
MIRKSVLIFLFGIISLHLISQQKNESPSTDPWIQYKELSENSVFRNLKWNSIGPKSIGGHITRLTSIPGKSNIIFAISGWHSVAVWKTTDGGFTWKPALEKGAEHFGSIAIAPSNTDIVWIGSREDGISKIKNGKGINQITWDLRLKDPVIDTKYYNILGEFLQEGKYKVQMVVGKKTVATKEMIVDSYITGEVSCEPDK